MTREELQAASEALREASVAATTDDAEQRLYDQSDQFARLAIADRGPDHGRLARHENALEEIKADDPAVEEHVDAALEHVRAYRETVEGV